MRMKTNILKIVGFTPSETLVLGILNDFFCLNYLFTIPQSPGPYAYVAYQFSLDINFKNTSNHLNYFMGKKFCENGKSQNFGFNFVETFCH